MNTPSHAIATARKRRAELVAALGGCCKICGDGEPLQFDCIVPQGWVRHGSGVKARIRFYWQQHLVGNLQLLCKTHHLQKSVQDNLILLHARSRPKLLAALTSNIVEAPKEPAAADWNPKTEAPKVESDWERKCRLTRERLGLL